MASVRRRPRVPEGAELLPTPEWWKELLLAWLGKAKSGRRKELAAAIGCDASAITVVTRPRTRHSILVRAISEHTGIPVPSFDVSDPDQLAIVSLLEGLAPADLEILRSMAEALNRARRGV